MVENVQSPSCQLCAVIFLLYEEKMRMIGMWSGPMACGTQCGDLCSVCCGTRLIYISSVCYCFIAGHVL